MDINSMEMISMEEKRDSITYTSSTNDLFAYPPLINDIDRYDCYESVYERFLKSVIILLSGFMLGVIVASEFKLF